MFTIDNLLVDQVLRGTMTDKSTGKVLFTIDQIKDPVIECSGETVYSTDRVGAKIASFDRSKDATLSGSNAMINLGLLAAQLGSDKRSATTDDTIIVPRFEILDAQSDGTLLLDKVPVGTTGAEIKYIYPMNNHDLTDPIELGTTAESTFSINAANKKITLPTENATGKFAVLYEYEADGSTDNGAVEIVDSAEAFAKGGEFLLEVLFCEPCDTNKKFYGYVVFGNAKMQNNVTLNMNSEADHGFTIECMQDYCSAEKQLFRMIVPEN